VDLRAGLDAVAKRKKSLSYRESNPARPVLRRGCLSNKSQTRHYLAEGLRLRLLAQ